MIFLPCDLGFLMRAVRALWVKLEFLPGPTFYTPTPTLFGAVTDLWWQAVCFVLHFPTGRQRQVADGREDRMLKSELLKRPVSLGHLGGHTASPPQRPSYRLCSFFPFLPNWLQLCDIRWPKRHCGKKPVTTVATKREWG